MTNLISIRGRLSRMQYLGRYVVLSLIALLLGAGLALVTSLLESEDASIIAWGAMVGLAIAIVVASLCVAVRRIHDLGYSGLHLFTVLAVGLVGVALEELSEDAMLSSLGALVSLAPYLLLALWPGQAGDNAYGPPPGRNA